MYRKIKSEHASKIVQKLESKFPFGHGLSYTEFKYSKLCVKRHKSAVRISFNLKNSGKIAGAEVAQVYVHVPGTQSKRYVASEKVYLEPGERRKVCITLYTDDSSHPFSIWDEVDQKWIIQPGTYQIEVGSSSHDIRLHDSIYL